MNVNNTITLPGSTGTASAADTLVRVSVVLNAPPPASQAQFSDQFCSVINAHLCLNCLMFNFLLVKLKVVLILCDICAIV